MIRETQAYGRFRSLLLSFLSEYRFHHSMLLEFCRLGLFEMLLKEIIQHTISCRKIASSPIEKHQNDDPNSSNYIVEKDLQDEQDYFLKIWGDKLDDLMAPPSELDGGRNCSSPPRCSTFPIYHYIYFNC